MKTVKTCARLSLVLALTTLIQAAFAQGTVLCVNLLDSGPNAPVYDVDGTTKLAGPAFLAQLYAGPVGGSLQAIGQPIAFLGAGYFFGGTVTIPTVPTGAFATVQVAAWRAADGSTFSAANHAGGHVGTSSLLNIGQLGGPNMGAASLFGLQSFSLYVVPEASALALGLIGSLAFGLHRWMRLR